VPFFFGHAYPGVDALAVSAHGALAWLMPDLAPSYPVVPSQGVVPPSEPEALSITRLGSDTQPRVVVSSSDGVRMLRARGAGTFSTARRIVREPSLDVGFPTVHLRTDPPIASAGALTTADLDGDGFADLLTSAKAGLRIRYGRADGSFDPAATIVLHGGAERAQTADLDSDGQLDIVASSETGARLAMVLGRGARSFAAPVRYAARREELGIEDVQVGDVDGDGVPDVLFAGDTAGGAGQIAFRQGRGDGTLGPTVVIRERSLASYHDPVLADLDRDTIPDIVFGTDYDLAVMLGRGGGAFAKPVRYASKATLESVLAVGDVDQDGIPDFVSSANRDLAVVHGRGDGTLSPPRVYGTPGEAGAIGDVDGDGKPDLVLANAALDNVFVLFNRGNGTFRAPAHAEDLYASPRSKHWRRLARAAPIARRSLRFDSGKLVWTTGGRRTSVRP
jgi:hypothetical protein